MQQLLTLFQRLAIQNKSLILNLLLSYEVAVLLIWIVAAWAIITQQPSQWFWFESGEIFGIATLSWYVLTLIPGILKRLQLWPQISSSLMLFRRHFGISMFLTGFVHLSVVSLLPVLSYGGPFSVAPRNIAGFIGWMLLFPLWLTSNDYSVKKMGRTWHTIHKLTYLAMFAIFAHVAIVLSKWGLVMGAVLLLEIFSGFVAWRRKKSIPVTPTQPAQSQI